MAPLGPRIRRIHQSLGEGHLGLRVRLDLRARLGLPASLHLAARQSRPHPEDHLWDHQGDHLEDRREAQAVRQNRRASLAVRP